ncbi:MAG: hypothetical protein K2Q25_09255 [Mycobacteriaceae bacterium]|nr:hypothetical protein [Mycobacteriaceae bacterium]
MRYNPPPNWPQPPQGWAPTPEWSPDPSWPPPPPGWKFWIEDTSTAVKDTFALGRLGRTTDDVEYFGDDRAWSADSGKLQLDAQLSATETPAAPIEVAAEDLCAQHLGCSAIIRWNDEHTYDIGTIAAISADASTISVKLAGLEKTVVFVREVSDEDPANPRLYLWT